MTKARRVVTQFFAVGLSLLLGAPARANDAPLVADAHVVSLFPTVNFGGVSNLYVGNGSFALLQFDLSKLPSGTISAQVTRANLTLFVNRINVGGAVDIAAVQTGWTETGVTSNNWPTIGATAMTVPVVDGEPAVLTASIQFPASVPTGSVEFLDGTTVLGTALLDGAGVATLKLSALSGGSHSIDARYTGDSNFKSVTSADLGLGGGSFTLKASTPSANGTSETVTLTIAPVNGFNQAVALSCSSLPANSSCGFSPSSVTLDGTKAATASLTLTTQASCSNTGGSASFGTGILLPLTFFFGICSRRKRLRALLFAACVFLIGSGCAGQKVTCFTPSGSYTITVTGTSNAGGTTVTQTTTIAITVGNNGAIGTNAQ